MYEFAVYFRGTSLRVEGPTIWARSLAEAQRKLRRQEKDAAKAFEIRQLPYCY